MPGSWAWQPAKSTFQGRCATMESSCNRHWITEDTPETLFLEALFQCCIRQMAVADDDSECHVKKALQVKYAEPLGLLLAIETGNALRFAIAQVRLPRLSLAERFPEGICS